VSQAVVYDLADTEREIGRPGPGAFYHAKKYEGIAEDFESPLTPSYNFEEI
jgi:hypothetical protein